jgi:hypothetical protein
MGKRVYKKVSGDYIRIGSLRRSMVSSNNTKITREKQFFLIANINMIKGAALALV